MSDEADTHVTRYELNLELKPIRRDLRDIKGELTAMRQEAWLGPRGRSLVTGAGFVSAIVAVILAVFH